MEFQHNVLIPSENVPNSNSELQILIESNSIQPTEKRKGILSLLSINAIVCGVEIVSSCAFTYIPPLLLRAGFSEALMAIILGVAPFIDMVTVPALAQWSDNSTLSLGRRRPIIIGLSTILIFASSLIPFSTKIASYFEAEYNSSIHMLILAVGVILLDFSYQAIFNPCEALLSDLMTSCDKKSQTLGFSIYSACLSLGCIIGYLIVCIKWTKIVPVNLYQEQICFLIITALMLPCLALTLSNKEEPLNSSPKVKRDHSTAKCLRFVQPVIQFRKYLCSNFISQIVKKYKGLCFKNVLGCISFPIVKFLCLIRYVMHMLWSIFKKVLFLPIGCIQRVQDSPTVIQRLFLVELFGWTALHCHDRFFTDFVGQYIYEGNPSAKENSSLAVLYDDGIQMGSWCLFLQSLAACLYAFFLQQHLVHLMGARMVFLGGIWVLFMSMALTMFLPSVQWIKLATALSGIGTAALTTTPNMLVTQYFKKKEIYMPDSLDDAGGLSRTKRGIGAEVAVLDTAYYLSQIVLSFFLGPLVEVFRSSLLYIVVSTVASAITFYFATRVIFSPQEVRLVFET